MAKTKRKDWDNVAKFYDLLLEEVYHEPDNPMTEHVVDAMVPAFIEYLGNDEKDARILDLGCGAGYALEKLQEKGFKNVEGLSLNKEDAKAVKAKGFTVHQSDANFSNFNEEFDAVWMRHVLEHSPFPFYTIVQLNKMLKMNGKAYVEVPAPNNKRHFEHWPNHYSIMGSAMFVSLFKRAGFKVDAADTLQIDLTHKENGDIKEFYDCFMLEKIAEPAILYEKLVDESVLDAYNDDRLSTNKDKAVAED